MNFDNARNNMVTQQIRAWDVINKDILNVMLSVHREEFVPVQQRKLAFTDTALPLSADESMMKPVVEGRMLQSINLEAQEDVLEIGTGSGYVTALISKLAHSVTSIDINEQFTQSAKNKLIESQIENAELTTADFYNYQPNRKFDVIIITGSLSSLPLNVFNWLNAEGRIFAIIGQQPIMEARVYSAPNEYTSYFDTSVKALKKPDQPKTFQL